MEIKTFICSIKKKTIYYTVFIVCILLVYLAAFLSKAIIRDVIMKKFILQFITLAALDA